MITTFEYKIYDILEDYFKDRPLNMIDFKRHLKSDVALNKLITKAHGGRPDKSEYYNGNELIAVIRFEFSVNSSNLVTERKEWLRYITKTEEDGPEILIKRKVYDHTNLVDGELAMKEREMARKSVIQSLKTFLGGVLMQALQIPMSQVLMIIHPFVDEFKPGMDGFVEYGYGDFKDALLALDLSTTDYTWLSIPIDATGTTVRDYMVYQVS